MSEPLPDNSYALNGRFFKLRPGDQQLPRTNDLPVVQDLVTADIAQRRLVGIARYGTPLQPHNGRDTLRDAYEEALDLAMYLRQLMWERDNPLPLFNKDRCYACENNWAHDLIDHVDVPMPVPDEPAVPMNLATLHLITVEPSSKPDARGLYEASCSCGQYRSVPVALDQAHSRGKSHLTAIGRIPPPNGWTCGPHCRSRGHEGRTDVCL